MCDTLVALGNSTSDGVTIFGKNSDREPNEAQLVEYHPRVRRGGQVECTYVSIPDVDETYSILISRPFWMWGAEMGANENGVAIGNEAVFTNVAKQRKGLLGMDLLRLGLERSRDADEALDVIVGLLEEHGQGGNCSNTQVQLYHNSFIIADPKKAWVLETVGKSWVAEIVKDVRTISNALTVQDRWDRSSEDLDPSREGRVLDFSGRFTSPMYTFLSKARERRRLTQGILEKKKGEIDIEVMKEALRAHATKSFSPSTGSMADVCMHAGGLTRPSQTVSSLVSVLHEKMPVHWFTCSSAPCLSVYKPFFVVDGCERSNTSGGGKFDEGSFWWRRERFHRTMISNYDRAPEVISTIKKVERALRNEADSLRKGVTGGSQQNDALVSLTLRSFEMDLDVVSRYEDLRPKSLPFLYGRYWREQDKLARIEVK
jgi:dipeptidase